jgi:haloalkane dehalogenase
MNKDISLPTLSVLDSEMAYRDAGSRDAPVALFLHGNPTSSFIWRNIIPLVAPVAHCIAPDLIGFGQSGKPDIPYRFEDHVRYLDAFIAEMGIGSAYLVAQDWGSGLALHLAERRPDFVRGLGFMEFIHPFPTWEVFLRGSKAREIFRKFRTPGEGERLILENNAFVELMPGAIRRELTDEEMAVYRAPFPTPQSRKPTWRFPNELPIAGEPADVYATMERAHAALAASTYPKLLFGAEPGALVPLAYAEELAGKLKDCRFVKLGDGIHFLQEDHPETIGRSVAAFITEVEGRAGRHAAQRDATMSASS